MSDEQEDRHAEKAYAYLMAQLMESEKFQAFFHMNFELAKVPVEGSEEEFTYHVRELPENEVYKRMQAAVADRVEKVGGNKIRKADATVLDRLDEINPNLVKK